MEFIELCQHLSNALESQINQNQNQNLHLSVNILSSIFIGYAVLSILTKKSAFLLAFLLCAILQSSSIMQVIDESIVYLLVCVIYSYIFALCRTSFNKLGCVIIIFLAIVLYVDSALFGNAGIYGESQTMVYKMGDYFSLFAHFFFISTFINFTKIRDDLFDFFSAFVDLSRSVYYIYVYWYNIR